jgi:hypothetical protein
MTVDSSIIVEAGGFSQNRLHVGDSERRCKRYANVEIEMKEELLGKFRS